MSEIQQVKRGTLVRHVPMRLVDVSLSGCLVEAEQDLGVGTTGTLEVDLWGVPCRYPIACHESSSDGRQSYASSRGRVQLEKPLDREGVC